VANTTDPVDPPEGEDVEEVGEDVVAVDLWADSVTVTTTGTDAVTVTTAVASSLVEVDDWKP
jgi:hypothetical protein